MKDALEAYKAEYIAVNDFRDRLSDTPTCEYLQKTGKLPTECKI